jgi:hypothetical protein
VLRDDGINYSDHVTELVLLLLIKMVHETPRAAACKAQTAHPFAVASPLLRPFPSERRDRALMTGVTSRSRKQRRDPEIHRIRRMPMRSAGRSVTVLPQTEH